MPSIPRLKIASAKVLVIAPRQGGLSKDCICVKVPSSPLPLEMLIIHLQGVEKIHGINKRSIC